MKKKTISSKDNKLPELQPIDEIIDELVKAGLSRKEILKDLKIEWESVRVREEDSRKDICCAEALYRMAYFAGLRVSFK